MGDTEPVPDRLPAAVTRSRFRPPFLSSKLFFLAAVLMAIGAALWIREGITASAGPPDVPSAAGGLVAEPGGTASPAASAPASGAPLTFRLGAGFVAGCLIGWAFRLVFRTLLLVTGSIVLVVAVLKGLGWIDLSWFGLDWASVEARVHEGVEQAEAQATAMKDATLRLVPGGITTFLGLFVGARRGR